MGDIFENSARYFFLNILTEPLEVTPPGGSAKTVRGHFYNENVPVNLGGVTVINDKPSIEIQKADCTGVVVDSKIVRLDHSNETYYIIDKGIEDKGIVNYSLSRVKAS